MAEITPDDVKTAVDLAAWVAADLRQEGIASGGTIRFRCPFHDDRNPSLAVRDDRWRCFTCNFGGDIFDWRRRREGLSFAQQMVAFRREMGEAPPGATKRNGRTKTQPRQGSSRWANPPGANWQTQIAAAVQQAQNALHGPAGTRAMVWLEERGIDAQTAALWGLGFLPRGTRFYTYREDEAASVVIPWSDGTRYWRVSLRRAAKSEPKYRLIKGSKQALYGLPHLQGHPYCFVTEGEFDAILLWRLVHGFADVVTLGSADGRLPSRWIPAVLQYRAFFIATDADGAGEKAAAYWQDQVGNKGVRAIPPGGAKDLTDAYRLGHCLESWGSQQVALLESRVGNNRPVAKA